MLMLLEDPGLSSGSRVREGRSRRRRGRRGGGDRSRCEDGCHLGVKRRLDLSGEGSSSGVVGDGEDLASREDRTRVLLRERERRRKQVS